MAWSIDQAVDWDADTLDLVGSILRDPRPPFPAHRQRIGASTVNWWEPEPGIAVIMAHLGSVDDRTFAEQIIREQLEAFGYHRARFGFDKLAAWPDIMAKAKRLIQSNQVTVLRNGFNSIVGHVIGDHGEYNTEIGRDDPNSRAITTWQCECDWDQYAFNRTRQWKKYEGRPCAHVLALYWKALATPLDEDVTEEQQGQMGTGQKMGPPPGGAPGPAEPLPGLGPSTFTPGGEPVIGQQPSLFGDAPKDVAQAPLAPPGPPGVLPPAPMEQAPMQPALPGMSPAGMPAPPGSVSVPGARPPTPFGPVQYPGGTYSSEEFSPPMIVRAIKPLWGLAEGKSKEHGAGQYREVAEGETGEVMSQDPTTGWVEVSFPVNDASYLEPTVVRCFVEPSDIEETRIRNQSPWIERR